MLLPAPNPQRVPWMTYALIAANVAVFVLFNIPLGTTGVSPADPRLAEYIAAIRVALPPDVPIAEAIGQITAYDLFVFDHGFRPAPARPSTCSPRCSCTAGSCTSSATCCSCGSMGMSLDRQQKEIASWSFLVAGLVGGIGRPVLFLLSVPGSIGSYIISLIETVGFVVGTFIFVRSRLQERPGKQPK